MSRLLRFSINRAVAAAHLARERAVLAGVAVAVLQAVAAGELTKATAVPVLGGIVLRFFVTPYDRPAARRLDLGDHGDHGEPDLFHTGQGRPMRKAPLSTTQLPAVWGPPCSTRATTARFWTGVPVTVEPRILEAFAALDAILRRHGYWRRHRRLRVPGDHRRHRLQPPRLQDCYRHQLGHQPLQRHQPADHRHAPGHDQRDRRPTHPPRRTRVGMGRVQPHHQRHHALRDRLHTRRPQHRDHHRPAAHPHREAVLVPVGRPPSQPKAAPTSTPAPQATTSARSNTPSASNRPGTSGPAPSPRSRPSKPSLGSSPPTAGSGAAPGSGSSTTCAPEAAGEPHRADPRDPRRRRLDRPRARCHRCVPRPSLPSSAGPLRAWRQLVAEPVGRSLDDRVEKVVT